ncbi:MAG: hypothetical protein OXM88_15405 [bacterium]|nr:hypothetical protein [bacterium]
MAGRQLIEAYVIDTKVMAERRWIECMIGLKLSEKAKAHHTPSRLERVE